MNELLDQLISDVDDLKKDQQTKYELLSTEIQDLRSIVVQIQGKINKLSEDINLLVKDL